MPRLHAQKQAASAETSGLPPVSLPRSSPYAPTKDVRCLPLFRESDTLRWLWRLYALRLTPAGRWFFGLSVILGFVGSLSLDVQTYIPFLYAAGIWAVAFAALLVNTPPRDTRLRVRHADRITAGETLPVDIEVELPKTGQRRRGRVGSDWNVLPMQLPPEVDSLPPDGMPLGAIARGEMVHLRMGLFCARRGVCRLPGWRIETDFPFGLLNAYRSFTDEERTVLVFPAYTPLSRLTIPTGRRYQPGGVNLASQMGESFEYLGNREYREGDNVRDIDWRATARLAGQPIVREWREEYFLRVAVILDTHVPPGGAAPEREARRDAFERAVSLTAAASDYMARQDYLVDLFAAGPNLYHLTAGRSLAYQEQILEILACVEENREEPFQQIAPQLHENLAQITSVVCVLLDWTQSRQAFVDGLRQSGAGVKVILVRDTPPTLPPPTRSSSEPGGEFVTVGSAAFRGSAGPEAV